MEQLYNCTTPRHTSIYIICVRPVKNVRFRHSGGVVLLDDGTIFEVLSKVNKQSLQFQVVSSKGLSNSLGGILGVNLRTFQFNLDTKNQTIQMIDSGESVSGNGSQTYARPSSGMNG